MLRALRSLVRPAGEGACRTALCLLLSSSHSLSLPFCCPDLSRSQRASGSRPGAAAERLRRCLPPRLQSSTFTMDTSSSPPSWTRPRSRFLSLSLSLSLSRSSAPLSLFPPLSTLSIALAQCTTAVASSPPHTRASFPTPFFALPSLLHCPHTPSFPHSAAPPCTPTRPRCIGGRTAGGARGHLQRQARRAAGRQPRGCPPARRRCVRRVPMREGGKGRAGAPKRSPGEQTAQRSLSQRMQHASEAQQCVEPTTLPPMTLTAPPPPQKCSSISCASTSLTRSARSSSTLSSINVRPQLEVWLRPSQPCVPASHPPPPHTHSHGRGAQGMHWQREHQVHADDDVHQGAQQARPGDPPGGSSPLGATASGRRMHRGMLHHTHTHPCSAAVIHPAAGRVFHPDARPIALRLVDCAGRRHHRQRLPVGHSWLSPARCRLAHETGEAGAPRAARGIAINARGTPGRVLHARRPPPLISSLPY